MKETLNQDKKDCIEPDSVRQKCSEQKVIIVDVRSDSEYQSGHIDGAINLPLCELPHAAVTLPQDALIVTVCNKGGGRSEQAANLLKVNGWVNARWLCGGYLGWSGLDSCA
ncbi:MAG: rhodanese-like domain-containing protein [Candidatus Altimarinota bacterium]